MKLPHGPLRLSTDPRTYHNVQYLPGVLSGSEKPPRSTRAHHKRALIEVGFQRRVPEHTSETPKLGFQRLSQSSVIERYSVVVFGARPGIESCN